MCLQCYHFDGTHIVGHAAHCEIEVQPGSTTVTWKIIFNVPLVGGLVS